MIYADTSALLKLARREDETEALRAWLVARPDDPVVTSELGRVELLRAAARIGSDALVEARAVVDDVDLVVLDRSVQDLACEIATPSLRNLDSLHLATAVLLRPDLDVVLGYDRRLLDAATELGFAVASPT